jgi:hypothetical protein
MMKNWIILATLIILVAITVPAAAQTAAPPSGHESHGVQETVKPSIPTAAKDSHAGHDTGKPSSAADAVQTNAHDHASGKHTQMMDEHMKKMTSRMEKIKATADPKERRKLMQENMASMREGMKMMKEAPGCPMMADGMKSGEPGKMEMKPMGTGPMMACHRTMEKKMEMMQLMLEGLLEASQMKL